MELQEAVDTSIAGAASLRTPKRVANTKVLKKTEASKGKPILKEQVAEGQHSAKTCPAHGLSLTNDRSSRASDTGEGP